MTDSTLGALRLRAWALGALAGEWTPPPEVPAPAWRLFLRAERCALALSIRSETEAPPLLHAAGTIELQRILSARAQLERLGRGATERGLRAIVLKGGLLALIEATGVDLSDIDVLAQPGQAGALAKILDDDGYAVATVDAESHLGQRVPPDGVHIEVHFAIREMPDGEEAWKNARPVAGHAGLWQLGAADHCWHVLVHSALTHPFRRGTLRDLLLIGRADEACAGADRTVLGRRVSEHPDADVLHAVLSMARDLRDGTPPADPFREDAAANYLLRRRRVLTDGTPLFGPQVMRAVYARLSGERARQRYWAGVWNGESEISPWKGLALVQEWWPSAGKMLRRWLRILRAPLAELLAAPIASRARRLAAESAPAHWGRTSGATTLPMRPRSP